MRAALLVPVALLAIVSVRFWIRTSRAQRRGRRGYKPLNPNWFR